MFGGNQTQKGKPSPPVSNTSSRRHVTYRKAYVSDSVGTVEVDLDFALSQPDIYQWTGYALVDDVMEFYFEFTG